MGDQQVISWTTTLKKPLFNTQKLSLVLAPKIMNGDIRMGSGNH